MFDPIRKEVMKPKYSNRVVVEREISYSNDRCYQTDFYHEFYSEDSMEPVDRKLILSVELVGSESQFFAGWSPRQLDVICDLLTYVLNHKQ